MKFTEGYWLRSERANAIYAAQGYHFEKMENGLRVMAPVQMMQSRANAVDTATLTVEFTSSGPNSLCVRSWHYSAYESGEPRFEVAADPQPVSFEEDEEEIVMSAGKMRVCVSKQAFGYRFEAEGRVLTGCGFRNLGYMRYDRKPATMFSGKDYMRADYDPYVTTDLSLQPDEYVYGLGERFTAFVKNGQTVDIWNEDGGSASQIAYKNVPLYITNKHYGVFVDHTTPVSFEVASEKVEYVGISVPGEELRYHIIYGETPKDVLRHYTALLGRPALPPAWSYGLWLTTSFTTSYDEKTVTSFIDGMAERDIPLSVFHYDCFWMREFQLTDFEWNSEMFPDVEAMLARVKARGLKICAWVNPYIAQDTDFFREGVEKGYFVMRADGRGVKQIDNWQPGMALVDFTNPEAYAWYAGRIRWLMRLGVDCIKSDFGERVPVDVVWHNGADPMGMHNYYAYLYNRCVFDVIREERGEGEAVVFARTATAGGQQFPVHWGGDNSASYPSLAETLRGGLSLAMSGFSFWSHDIAGFEQTATPDLYKRWVQFGMLSTHSRLHGSKSYRVPWHFDEESSDVLRYFTNLKCRLMPYLFASSAEAHYTGVPVMRPMVMEFGGPDVATLERQYMLGDSLLVAPVMREDGTVEYYLPEGNWTHLLSGEERPGGWHADRYDYFSLPLYVRQNTLLPMGAHKDRPDYDYAEGLSLHLYALQDGATAEARVPDTNGNWVLEADAARAGGQIKVRLSAPLRQGTLVLHHCAVGSVQGGEHTAEGNDTVIHIGDGETELTIQLT